MLLSLIIAVTLTGCSREKLFEFQFDSPNRLFAVRASDANLRQTASPASSRTYFMCGSHHLRTFSTIVSLDLLQTEPFWISLQVAVPDVVEAAKDADILIFVLPHQFIRTLCSTLLDNIKPTAVGLSLIKGFGRGEGNNIGLISKIIEKNLRIQCNVLMGANLANEVAEEKFCETTIGCKDKRLASVLRDLIQTANFRVVVLEDCEAVEVCGALKNIVACAAGFIDGLGLGDNTKAAVIRLGLMEMVKFVDTFYSGSKLSTFFESCGIADLITTCYGGRNRRVCEQFVKTGKTIRQLEDELLAGQKLQGPATADEVHDMLKSRNLMDKFPLFTAVHRICTDQLRPADLIDQIRSHPEHV
ncbi:PREDICTED: glycerol-3-phosphate dehydrogenase [NAD(+)], cytoplasmic-like isoform X1 [Dinoponera quadriceps]|uniref:Glycerol-3-phosphate dehydrogenase [NAD(+)] n=1 Tax=Dinoponera quadriceps TaxID=609295 RepID=A0A6P3XFH0_DINQU|nr:PREDICTED: glycerol-3-phosphate dehydrogenase [NAD(+)], cytoplasmic-like isoform X1 [Dinoponera quadriceps]